MALAVIGVIGYMSCADMALAQPVPSKEGASTHIFPAGARRGTAVEVRVGAECIPPEMGFLLWGHGVAAAETLGERLPFAGEPSPRRKPTEIPINYPQEWSSRIEVAADAPLGPAWWRLTGTRGGTPARPFVVGDLPEWIEQESNSTLGRAEAVTLPITINGQICGERDVDYYSFAVAQGATVHCEVVASRIGSPLDALLEVRGPDGRPVAAEDSHAGCDPLLSFQAVIAGEHLLRIAHVGFQGAPNYVYRLTITDGPAAADQPGAVVNAAAGDRDHPRIIAAPAEVEGTFLTPADEDWYQFEARQDEWFSVAVLATAGSQALPLVELLGPAGERLAGNSPDAAGPECRFEWRAPAAGMYRLRLFDLGHGSRGGPDYVYRLALAAAQPGFSLRASSDVVNVLPGGQATLDLVVRRTGGWDGPIDLVAEGLPSDVTLTPGQVPAGQGQIQLSFAATASAAPLPHRLRIIGRAAIGGQTIEQAVAAPHLGLDAEGVSLGLATVDHLLLTVQHPPLFRIYCSEAYQYAHRGTLYPYLMEVERLNGYQGEVVLQIADRQNRDLDGIEMLPLVIPPGRTQGYLPIYLPETMHINVQSQNQLYCQGHAYFDAAGARRSMLFVSEMRCMLRSLPPVAQLVALEPVLTVRPGEPIRCQLSLERTANFPGPLDVRLMEEASTAGFTADAVQIPAGETECEVLVKVPAEFAPSAQAVLTFRGTGPFQSSAPVISTVVTEARVTVRAE